MYKKFKKMTCILILVLIALMCISCKKKVKHKWIEVGSDPNPQKVTLGVHPERGSDSNAVPIVLAPIMYPLGLDKDGKPQYKKYFYELEELTPETLDGALKGMGLISQDSLFCDLILEESDEVVNAGPGAETSQLTKKGIVRYVDLGSSLDNSDNYAGKHSIKDLVGLINQSDIEYCITQTFEENFQLVSCDIVPVDMDVYNQVHGIK